MRTKHNWSGLEALLSPQSMSLDEAIRSRRSTRAYKPDPVSKETVTQLLDIASRAPSNSNTQPWAVHVLAGEAKQRLTDALLASHERDDLPAAAHFPAPMSPRDLAHQADFGQRYYAALGIDRSDATARLKQTARNFAFFDAPVGLIFTIDERLTRHSWADYGMFLQTLMVAAAARGLATCPQVSFVRHGPVVAEHLKLPADHIVVCGMSLGYADPEAAVNAIVMPRTSPDDFAVFHGFDDAK